MKIEEQRVIVTGATSGIGKEIARLFLSRGASVAVNHRKEDEKKKATEDEFRELLEKANQPADKLCMVKADISHEDQVEEMFGQAIAAFGGVDTLVNNAGVDSETPSEELEPETLFKELDINLRGSILCALAAIRHFISEGKEGCILNNTSVHEVIPKPGFLPYAVGKAGLRGMTRTLALEFASRGIRVNSVAPGAVETPMNEALKDSKVRSEMESHIPQRRIIQPDEIAHAFLYLSSPEARSITGQTLFVDSGLTLYPDFEENWSSP